MSDIQGLAVQRTGDLDVTADAGHWLDMLLQEYRLSPAHRRIASCSSTPTRRLIWPDAETARLLREHRTEQLRARMRAGGAWQDNDLILCPDDVTPCRPDYVTRHFKALAAQAGLPVIKVHEGRHSAAGPAVRAGGGGGRESNPPTTRHAVHWF